VWPDPRVEELVNREFLPFRVHVRNTADEYQRLAGKYGVEWTPTILMLDPAGNERHRLEGFLPVEEFVHHLEFGVARTWSTPRRPARGSRSRPTTCESTPGR
jgi:thioredoxin-related protein